MWLGKENISEFTGHCFRRTSATAYANVTGDKLGLKRLGGWHSDSVVERYIGDSEIEKKKQAKTLAPEPTVPQPTETTKIETASGTYTFNFTK